MTDRTYPAGVPSWVEVEAPDPTLARAFYGELFGWTFEEVGPGDASASYVVARLDGRDVAGVAARAEGPARWNTYVAVDDAEAAVARAQELGGRTVLAPAAAGGAGVAAAVADPDGVEIRLWEARGRRGAQAVNEPGAWNFSNLHTAHPDVSAFYTALFGWELDDIGFGVMIRVPGYGDHLAATIDPGIHDRQDGISAPPGFADAVAWLSPPSPAIAPSWHVAFTVADRDAVVASAQRLGASVLATGDNEWTHDAVVRDPQGAEFSVSQFDPQG